MQYLTKKEEPPLGCLERLKLFFVAHWAGVVCVLVPLLFLPVLLPFPAPLPASAEDDSEYTIAFTWTMKPIKKHCWCGYCLMIMAVFWVCECIPLPVTSFFPLVILPLSGVMDTVTTCNCYFNSTIVLFLGSLMLAACVEQSGLHVRLALATIRLLGYSHYKLLLGLCIVTTFVSMWITNTAATTMMVPIVFALLEVFEKQGFLKVYDTNSSGEKEASDITACYFCTVTYSATIGGIGTLVGTTTNLVFKGLFATEYPKAPDYFSFPMFSAFTIPTMIILETALYFYVIFFYLGFMRPGSKQAKASKLSQAAMDAAKKTVMAESKKLGSITFWEIMVVILFSGAMVAFFSRSPGIFTGWADKLRELSDEKDKKFISDAPCASFACFLILLLPSTTDLFKNFRAKYKEQLPSGRVKSVLDWKTCHDTMPWSFAFLLGGGFALSTAAKPAYSDLNGKLGEFLKGVGQGLPPMLILFMVTAFTVFVTNFASNVATCNVITPIAMQMAKELNLNPLTYALATGLAASFCFFLPVGTPGNLVVQSAAKIPTKKMMVCGAIPTINTIILLYLALIVYGPVVWPDINKMPDWTKPA